MDWSVPFVSKAKAHTEGQRESREKTRTKILTANRPGGRRGVGGGLIVLYVPDSPPENNGNHSTRAHDTPETRTWNF